MFRPSHLAAAATIFVLAGCSMNVGASMFGSDRQAQVVSDEPYAAKVGAAVLEQGGNAADAASAMFFVLSVGYPAGAGLGAGGVCLVRDENKNASEEFVFLPQGETADGFAVPAAVAGFAALQRDYGFLPWQKVVSPAEGYARTGFPMTRALATRLGDGSAIKADKGLAAIYLDETGAVKKVGSTLTNPHLAETLAAIRLEGGQALYTGSVAKAIVAYSAAQGHPITAQQLAAFAVTRGNPLVIEVGDNYVFLPSAKSGTGAFLVALAGELKRVKPSDAAGVAGVAKAVLAKQAQSGESEIGASGFAVTDARGQSVACAVSMNAPFGSARSDETTGLVLAAAHTPNTLSPVIASSSASGPAGFIGAGVGVGGTALIADALVRVGVGQTIAAKTDLHPIAANPGETGNVIVCDGRSCLALSDPSAAGMGISIPLPEKKKK